MSGRYLSMMCALGSAFAGSIAFTAPAAAQSSGLRTAQDATVDLFARDRSIPVRQRPRPEYEALGLPLGAFTAFPKLEAGLESNNNIYATSSGEISDEIWRVRPEVSLASNWPRHSLSAYARASLNRYQDYDTENSNDWSTGAATQLDFARRWRSARTSRGRPSPAHPAARRPQQPSRSSSTPGRPTSAEPRPAAACDSRRAPTGRRSTTRTAWTSSAD
jgi:hypothetical protein